MSWVAVVPVKGNPGAKSRLADLPERAALADAFALDTVAALVAASTVERVFVVTGDERLAPLLAHLGAVIVREKRTPVDSLNSAIEQGVAAARQACPAANVAVLTGDLPALLGSEVESALALGAVHPRSMVPDAGGAGTTTLLALAGVPFVPRFGPGSRRAHEAAGHVPLNIPPSASIRRDVDTPADLDAARARGLGRFTRALVEGADA
ncbi:2-phospho-L-lactate guanylyltransferase [Cryobacterium roopkundense]|uniref:Phosphoenolpyruvate guanylyltransferase n=1 Tax=Cryobacterium roopkundense TaxID=1001240 RepID=A0A7W8ZZE2_9MICO|nr:2-phospho-L-lactate guanylyltransferase [Cryobacterium roopkundense]MBB5642991.1 2-phospho-L-lactate guanylyltransferase [Cryobacterium roopkundense]